MDKGSDEYISESKVVFVLLEASNVVIDDSIRCLDNGGVNKGKWLVMASNGELDC